MNSSSASSVNTSAAAAAAAAAAARRQMKGRRTYSTSSSGVSNGYGGGGVVFNKTPSFGQNSEPVLSKNAITSKKYSKKLGRLRNCGAPKKDGGGGKHTWGVPGCELADDYLDAKDPNYDSEEAGNVVMVCTETRAKAKADGEESSSGNDDDPVGRGQRPPKKQLLDTDDLDAEIKPIILEYFQNGDTIEVITMIKKYSLPSRVRPLLVSYLVQLALENNNTSKELISRLLRDLSFEVIVSEQDYVLGFDMLLKNLPDLTLDNPDAPEKSGTFIARAIADRILGRSYLDRHQSDTMPDMTNDKVVKALDSARLLITMNDRLFHLSHIWGNKGGFLAVQELTDKINEIIQEYHDSADCNEAIRCLKELNVPHFHHEFVFEAIDFALQKGTDNSIELITELLYRLCQSVIITYDQLKMGILRIFDILPDIRLDVPNANSIMEKILKKCQTKGFVNENILDSALNKSRKRFVSEGDGGKIKEHGL